LKFKVNFKLKLNFNLMLNFNFRVSTIFRRLARRRTRRADSRPPKQPLKVPADLQVKAWRDEIEAQLKIEKKCELEALISSDGFGNVANFIDVAIKRGDYLQ
jgi:hypothetical protein